MSPLPFLILVYFAAFAVLAWRKPRLAALLVLFTLPAYVLRFRLFGVPTTFLEGMILVLFFVTVFRAVVERRVLRISRFWPLALAFLFIGILGVVVSPVTLAALGLYKAYIIDPILFYFVLVNTFEKEDLPLMWNVLGWSALVLTAVTVAQYVSGWGIPEVWRMWPDRRATGVFPFPNAVGLYLAPVVALHIGRLILTPHQALTRQGRAFAAAVVGFGVLAMLAARTEGAVAAVVVTAVCAGWFTRRRGWYVGAFVVLAVVALAVPMTRDILLFRDVSGDVRLALWQGTGNLLAARPWRGAGLSGFPTVYAEYKLDKHVELLQYPHNIFLDFWVELGILGLAWLLATLLIYWRSLLGWYRARQDPEAIILAAVMVAIVVYGIVDVPYFKNDLSVMFWMWLGSVAILLRKS